MKNIILLIVGIILAARSGYAQKILDSVICKYLVESGQIEKSVNNITRTGGKLLKNTNYFMEKKPVIRLSDSTTLQPVIFGCYKTHASKHLLIELKRSSGS